MQRLTIVRYSARSGRADENEALSRAVFAELRARAPHRIAYALCRSGDEFFHVFLNFAGDDAAPVVQLPAFKAFSADIASRTTAPPEQTRVAVEIVDSYGFAPETAMAPA